MFRSVQRSVPPPPPACVFELSLSSLGRSLMPRICRRLGPGFGLRLHLRGSPQATEKGFSPNLWTLPPRYGGKWCSLSGTYWSFPPAISNSFRLGGGNKSGISAHFTHILTVTISGTMEPGHWATTGDQVIARKFLMLRGDGRQAHRSIAARRRRRARRVQADYL